MSGTPSRLRMTHLTCAHNRAACEATESAQFRCTEAQHRRARSLQVLRSEPLDLTRERLVRYGVNVLAPEELVALVLQGGQQGRSAVEVACRLTCNYGNISRLATARPEELTTLSGISPAKAAALAASFQLGRIAVGEAVPSTLRTAADVAAVATGELSSARRERTIVLVCDAANHLRQVLPISEGSIDRAFLPVREILNAVLRHDGRAFAVAHNHPSGDPSPSDADVWCTGKLRAAAQVVGLRFLDHVVVAGPNWFSLLNR